MKKDFRDIAFEAVGEFMAQDTHVFFLSNDLGALSFEKLKLDYPNRVLNAGIAEQNMINVASGLALAGKIVFTYGFAAHMSARCYEQLRLNVGCMNLAVIGFGLGSGLSYGADGPTHQAIADIALMRTIPNMAIYNPSDLVSLKEIIHLCYCKKNPSYICLDKEARQDIYSQKTEDFGKGFAVLKEGCDLTLISTGVMTHEALHISKQFEADGISTKVVDFYRIKPYAEEISKKLIAEAKAIVTLEENSGPGGIGELIGASVADSGKKIMFRRFSLRERAFYGCFPRSLLVEKNGMLTQFIESLKKELLS